MTSPARVPRTSRDQGLRLVRPADLKLEAPMFAMHLARPSAWWCGLSPNCLGAEHMCSSSIPESSEETSMLEGTVASAARAGPLQNLPMGRPWEVGRFAV